MIIEVNCKVTGIELLRYSYDHSVFLLPLKISNHISRKHMNTKIVKR